MPIIAALLGAVMTGVFWWILFGNGKEAIVQWLDSKAEKQRQEEKVVNAILARETETRAPLRSLTDPREAATALMVAMAEARGEMTPEQAEVIKAQMRSVLDLNEDLDHRLAIAQHASRRAGSEIVVADEVVALFREQLTAAEQNDLITMLAMVAGVHGGPSDKQQAVLVRLQSIFAAERRPGPKA